MKYVIQHFGEWSVLKREPKGVRLWFWKWRIALRIARTIVRRSVYIVKPFGTDGEWTISTKISFRDKEWKRLPRSEEASNTEEHPHQP